MCSQVAAHGGHGGNLRPGASALRAWLTHGLRALRACHLLRTSLKWAAPHPLDGHGLCACRSLVRKRWRSDTAYEPRPPQVAPWPLPLPIQAQMRTQSSAQGAAGLCAHCCWGQQCGKDPSQAGKLGCAMKSACRVANQECTENAECLDSCWLHCIAWARCTTKTLCSSVAIPLCSLIRDSQHPGTRPPNERILQHCSCSCGSRH